jgi:hypothetical protein
MPWTLDTDTIDWIEDETGVRVDLDEMGDLVDELIDSTNEEDVDEILDILSENPTAEETAEWKREFWVLLKWIYLALALVAGAGALGVGDLEEVQILLLLQLGFLDRFAQEVATGAVSKPEARRRMRMYVNSARSSFWATLDRKMLEAGYTEERWIAIGDANTCGPCNEADALGWRPIGTFAQPGTGFVLVDPGTECEGLSSCRCQKFYRR